MTNEEYIKEHPYQFKDELDRWLFREFCISGGACSSVKEMEYSVARMIGEKLPMSLWKDAEGEELPNIDKEVIVLSDPIGDGFYRVSFGHRVDPDRVVRTSIDGKPMILHPQKYDKGGWNIQGVKYWLNLELPNKVKE